MKNTGVFGRMSKWAAHATGHPGAFLGAGGLIVGWLALGPVFGFSDSWRLVVNTVTTIVTLLMVFLIQHTQKQGHGGDPGEAGRADPGDARGAQGAA